MMKNIIHNTIIFLCSLIFTLFLVEAIIVIFDPLGGVGYIDGNRVVAASLTPDVSRRVAMKPGRHETDNWSFTIGANGYRVTPHAPANPKCTIAMIGDSVTFGSGVNDSETFTALLQDRYNDVRFDNMAVSGYNAPNFEPVARSAKVDGIIYLQVENDYEEGLSWSPAGEENRNLFYGLRYYLYVLRRTLQIQDVEWSQYEEAYAGFLERDGLLIFTTTDNEWLVNHHGAINVSRWSNSVSVLDSHPNAIGHEQLERSMREYVDSFLDVVCGEQYADNR